MDVVAAKAVVKYHDGDISHGAKVSELLCLEWEPSPNGVPPNVQHRCNNVHHQGRDEEENDPTFIGVVACPP